MAKVLHPKNHTWSIQGDIVTDRRRGQIWAFERHERCDYCPRERYRVINRLPAWAMSPWRYKGEIIPMEDRVGNEESVRQYVLETTTDRDIRQAASK